MNEQTLKGSRILLVEDEESLAVGLKYNLSEEEYSVEWVTDGKQALDCIQSKQYDLVILDIMLPFIDGFEVAQRVRVSHPQMPILILTAKTGVKDRIKGLEIGADDYLAKPFHLKELLLRIRGMLIRKMWYQKSTSKIPTYKFGKNEVNFDNLSCKVGKEVFRLTAREAMLLKYLIENKGKIVSRKELLEKVWGISTEIETRTVDNFIARLRKHLEPNHAKPVFIKSIRGAGYMFID
ncbi:response regulator transcription factor [Bacteroidota bacterium]